MQQSQMHKSYKEVKNSLRSKNKGTTWFNSSASFFQPKSATRRKKKKKAKQQQPAAAKNRYMQELKSLF